MVYVKEDKSEKVSKVEIISEPKRVYVETNGGNFKYYIPIVATPDYADVDTNTVLDLLNKDYKTIEDTSPDTLEYKYDSHTRIPQCVIDAAENESGAKLLE